MFNIEFLFFAFTLPFCFFYFPTYSFGFCYIFSTFIHLLTHFSLSLFCGSLSPPTVFHKCDSTQYGGLNGCSTNESELKIWNRWFSGMKGQIITNAHTHIVLLFHNFFLNKINLFCLIILYGYISSLLQIKPQGAQSAYTYNIIFYVCVLPNLCAYKKKLQNEKKYNKINFFLRLRSL